jgi:hypothetical protein
MLIVTGCSQNHLAPQLQMLRTVAEHEPDTDVWVYDLGGLDKGDRAAVRAANPRAAVRRFDYSRHPAYFDITKNAGEYAWKATILYAALKERRGVVMWLDAGCNLVAPLDRVRDEVRRVGLYSPISSGYIENWTHPETSRRLHTTLEDRASVENLSGGIVCVDWAHPVARQLVCRWACLSARKSVIAPRGSSRDNHRQDQAVLTALVADAQRSGRLARDLARGLLGITVHNE